MLSSVVLSSGKHLGGRLLLLGKLLPYGVGGLQYGKDMKSEVNVANKTMKQDSEQAPISWTWSLSSEFVP